MNEKSQTAAMIETYMQSRLEGGDPVIANYMLESDGRRLRRVLRELREAGYITEAPDNNQSLVTSKAYDELEAEPCDLCVAWNESTERKDSGALGKFDAVRFDSLPIGQRKCLTELALNQGDVEVRMVCVRCFGATSPSYEVVVPGVRDSFVAAWNSVGFNSVFVYFTNGELKAHATDSLRGSRVNTLVANNLSWGVQEIVGVSKEDAKLVEGRDGMQLVGGPRFSKDPEKWEEELATAKRSVAECIKSLQEDAEALERIDQAFKQYGGWTKFHSEYRERLVEWSDENPDENSED